MSQGSVAAAGDPVSEQPAAVRLGVAELGAGPTLGPLPPPVVVLAGSAVSAPVLAVAVRNTALPQPPRVVSGDSVHVLHSSPPSQWTPLLFWEQQRQECVDTLHLRRLSAPTLSCCTNELHSRPSTPQPDQRGQLGQLGPENLLRSAAGLHVPGAFGPEDTSDPEAGRTRPAELQDSCLHEDRGVEAAGR